MSEQEAAKALENITGLRGRSSEFVRSCRFIGMGPEHEKAIQRIMEEHVERRFLTPDPNQVLLRLIA